MKKFVFLLSVISAAALVWSFGAARAAGDSKAEITALEHKLIAATSADEVMTFQDEREIVLYDYMVPLQYVGAKAVRADFEKFFSSAKNVKGDFVSLRVVVDKKVGVAHSLQHFTWTDKDGKPGEGTFRVTDGWQKVKGQWRLFHTHVSFPLNPENGKAEMNLKE
ncbi:MAG: nuclear transport factor 2 family protein [Deltaproteobacteria bacterium]|nr:nuclear transport factor 2 family protein [Deltaproteobacteria bacterium]